MSRRKHPPVVITRKSKRLNRPLHVAAFLLTGGASVPISAAKAASNAGYNARTRKLAEAAEAEDYLDETGAGGFGDDDERLIRETDAMLRDLR